MKFTAKQEEVMRLMVLGFSPEGIADKLVVTKGCVNLHVHAIYKKLGLQYEKSRDLKVRAIIQYLKIKGVLKMDCQYKRNGVCMSPIPVTCEDECGFKHLTQLYQNALKEMEEGQIKIEQLTGQYIALLDRYNNLLKEISLSN